MRHLGNGFFFLFQSFINFHYALNTVHYCFFSVYLNENTLSTLMQGDKIVSSALLAEIKNISLPLSLHSGPFLYLHPALTPITKETSLFLTPIIRLDLSPLPTPQNQQVHHLPFSEPRILCGCCTTVEGVSGV